MSRYVEVITLCKKREKLKTKPQGEQQFKELIRQRKLSLNKLPK